MKQLHEYAVFCKLVRQYGDRFSQKFDDSEKENFKANQRYLREQGWKRITHTREKNTFGYYGVAYQRGDEVVIVHRGTQFYEFGNLAADLLLAAGRDQNPILDEAAAFTDQCVRRFRSLDGIKITHVGFSLGGYIAGTMAARNIPHDDVHAVTFDAPGVTPQDHRPDDRALKTRVKNYFLDPNLVNTCNPHHGCKYHVTDDPTNKPPEDQHNIDIHDFFSLMQPPSSLPRHHTHQQFAAWLDEGILQSRSSESVPTFVRIISDAFSSHNIERFIDHFANADNPRPTRVHQWPLASIEFTYGHRIMRAPQFRSAFDMLAHLFQGVTNIFANTLFNMSRNQNGEGIIGIKYDREDKIVYSNEHNLVQIAQITFLTIKVLAAAFEAHQSNSTAGIRPTATANNTPHSAFTGSRRFSETDRTQTTEALQGCEFQ